MLASVIVPSYNSRSTVGHCLRALMDQKATGSYEIVVVDSSDDGTGEFIESNFPAVQLISVPRRIFPGQARNLGVKRARGEILAFTDADCVPEPFWLEKMIRAHKEEEHCGAVGGSVLNGSSWNPVTWSGYLLEFNERLPTCPKRFVDFLPTCSVSFKRAIFERHGLFPMELEASEDRVFSSRLVAAGERLLFNPDIRVRHLFRPRFSAFLQHQAWLGRGSAVARRQVDLPQAWLVEHPLRWLAPVMRLLLIEARLARWDLANFTRFNLLLPLCLSGLIAWNIGFCTTRKNLGAYR